MLLSLFITITIVVVYFISFSTMYVCLSLCIYVYILLFLLVVIIVLLLAKPMCACWYTTSFVSILHYYSKTLFLNASFHQPKKGAPHVHVFLFPMHTPSNVGNLFAKLGSGVPSNNFSFSRCNFSGAWCNSLHN